MTKKYLSITKIICFALAITSPISVSGNIPDIGSPSGKYISPYEEKKLGESMMRVLRKRLPIITDPEINSYITSLGNRLLNTIEPNTDYYFFVIESNDINAFAMPGGYIGIHSALITNTDTESELAGVLAHEIGHVQQRHIARKIADMEKTSIPKIAAFIAGIIIASQNAEAGSAVINTTMAADAQHSLTFSRSNEKEADRIGLKILQKAGFDPEGMSSFFEVLLKKASIMGQPIEYLSTHPNVENRISDIKNLSRFSSYTPHIDNLNYSLIKTKIKVNSFKTPIESEKYFLNKIKNYNSYDVSYGLALAYLETRKFKQAQKIFLDLIKNDSERIAYINGLATSQYLLGNKKDCLNTYAKALKFFPGDKALIFQYAVFLIKTDNHNKAYELLKENIKTLSDHPKVYRLIAKAASGIGKDIESEKYIAEYYFQNGDYKTAINKYENILRSTKESDLNNASAKARINEIKAIVRESL